LKHPTSAGNLRRQVLFESRTVWFYVKRAGRAVRCGITAAALRLLDEERAGRSLATSPRAIFQQHREWVRALALIELSERQESKAGPLLLTEAEVRFQLACDDTPDLPDVLCI
jgi:hypothetical protein